MISASWRLKLVTSTGTRIHPLLLLVAVVRLHADAQIVPHIPPTLCNIYQHGGDLLYLQVRRDMCVNRLASRAAVVAKSIGAAATAPHCVFLPPLPCAALITRHAKHAAP